MTRPSQKIAERATLTHLLAAINVSCDSVDEGEAPDFILDLSGRKIGIEITMFQTGTTIDNGIARRPVESEWEILERASRDFQAANADIQKINVGLMFKSVVPGRREHGEFMAEVAAFIRAHADMLTGTDTDFWPHQFSSPLMAKYLRTCCLRTERFAVWHSNIVAGWVGRPDSTLADIVAAKSAKKFRPTDDLWLAIQSSHRISEMVLPLDGVADFAALPDLAIALQASPFARVFTLAFGGIYQWDRQAGWCNLTAPPLTGQGPTFEELKSVLNDPEWLADPLAKAEQIAKQVIAEFREKDEA